VFHLFYLVSYHVNFIVDFAAVFGIIILQNLMLSAHEYMVNLLVLPHWDYGQCSTIYLFHNAAVKCGRSRNQSRVRYIHGSVLKFETDVFAHRSINSKCYQ
jgi:hypothetical protein